VQTFTVDQRGLRRRIELAALQGGKQRRAAVEEQADAGTQPELARVYSPGGR